MSDCEEVQHRDIQPSNQSEKAKVRRELQCVSGLPHLSGLLNLYSLIVKNFVLIGVYDDCCVDCD